MASATVSKITKAVPEGLPEEFITMRTLKIGMGVKNCLMSSSEADHGKPLSFTTSVMFTGRIPAVGGGKEVLGRTARLGEGDLEYRLLELR